MRSPRHLWSGDWRLQSEEAREQAARDRERELAALRQQTERESETQQISRTAAPSLTRRARRLIATAAVLAIAGTALGAGLLIAGGGDDSTEPLPAVSSKPIQPKKGQTRAGAIYAEASPAVVSVRTSSGSGTGFLIDDDGTLVTNAHVVGESERVVVRFGQDGNNITGEVRGVDQSSDLAVVRIDPADTPNDAKPLKLADSREVQVGDTAIAIGNPFGLDRTATEGIVSGLGRHIEAPNGFDIAEVIQTDAPINPGNSGGPLLDVTGRVIGVNSQIATGGTSQGNVGIGFAVPSNTVRQVVPTLLKGQTIERPWLGVETTTPLSGNGAEVSSAVSGSPADDAGLQQGDVIDEVDGEAVDEPSDLTRIIATKRPGDLVKLHVSRGSQGATMEVRLGKRPAQVP